MGSQQCDKSSVALGAEPTLRMSTELWQKGILSLRRSLTDPPKSPHAIWWGGIPTKDLNNSDYTNLDERLEQFRLYESRRKTWTISTQCFGVQVAVSKFQIYIYLYIGAIAAQVRAALLSWSILERNGRLRPCCRLLLPMPVCVEAISDIYQLWYWPAAKWVPLWCISIPSLY